MSRSVFAHFLPALAAPEELAGGTVVVIDVLRATTTITAALAAGCREVIPCLEVEEARGKAARLPPGQAVLGGERGGLPIEGFHLGNSPAEYTPSAVGGKTVVFTTTNGTKALRACPLAERVLLGAFVNFTATWQAILDEQKVHLLCAGTRGKVTREDVLLAGALADALTRDASHPELNDEANLARAAWREILARGQTQMDRSALRALLLRELRDTQGGRNLAGIGLARDIDDVAQIDSLDPVGELDLQRWEIASASGFSA